VRVRVCCSVGGLPRTTCPQVRPTIGPPRMMRKTGFLRVLSLSKHRQVSEKSNSVAPHLICYRHWIVNRCVNEMVSPLANVEDVAIVCRGSLLRSLLEFVGQQRWGATVRVWTSKCHDWLCVVETPRARLLCCLSTSLTLNLQPACSRHSLRQFG
jgi:hypothetical protein